MRLINWPHLDSILSLFLMICLALHCGHINCAISVLLLPPPTTNKRNPRGTYLSPLKKKLAAPLTLDCYSGLPSPSSADSQVQFCLNSCSTTTACPTTGPCGNESIWDSPRRLKEEEFADQLKWSISDLQLHSLFRSTLIQSWRSFSDPATK